MSLCLGGEPSRLPTLADRRNDLGNLPNLWIKKSLGDLGNRQSALTTDHPMTRIRRESLHKEAAEAGGGTDSHCSLLRVEVYAVPALFHW